MPDTRTINIRDDIPDALRDQLIRQLEGGAPTVVGNFADLQRLGSQAIATKGPDEVFRLNPNTDEDEAKRGAQRNLDEVQAAADAAATAGDNPPAGAEEDAAGKDPVEAKRGAKVEASATRKG